MSGYLEVKYPFKSNLGLNPFKSWKRQWCILRPSPSCAGGGSLAVYCSEAGAAAGSVELPPGCVVRRAKSRSRPHAFAVFNEGEPRKPRILLAAPTLADAQVWIEKIKDLLNSSKLHGTETLLKDSYSVTVLTTELSRKCGMNGDSLIRLSASGLLVSCSRKLGSVVEWKHINDARLISESADKTCVVTVDSAHQNGGGKLKFSSPLAPELTTALQQALQQHAPYCGTKLSKSEGDLRRAQSDEDTGEVRRSSWYSGPSEVSLDDIDLVMSKEAARARGPLARCAAAPSLAPARDDSMCDRRSLVSIASGIYEEIPDLPADSTEPPTEQPAESDYCAMGRDVVDGPCRVLSARAIAVLPEEPTYESVVECVYATVRRPRRHPPPPLPPRRTGTNKLGSSWNCRMGADTDASGVTRHGSLGSLPLGYRPDCTLPKDKSRQAFSVFRKRLKSESRAAASPPDAKDGKHLDTKKKRFDFTPTRDIFKSFKVSRKMKNLKITTGLGKGETKSCEFLDETEQITTNRCSKSVECLENDEFDDFDADLSIEFNEDAVTTLALPQEIVDLIIRGREQFKIRLKEAGESDYLPMSPVVPPPALDHQYMVMSPRANLA
ncbi:hypothetical protein ABMA27_005817 [Loxostege sticticalis]|uniref:PH domain-containing protein n=1 Tax=Loxostege sticticalis TaxID=481309 RepID=A0ABR3HGL4_LOXSC